MKLSDYAKQMGVRYETAWRWFRDGKIQGQRIGPHTIIITEGERPPEGKPQPQRVAIYARVSSHEHQANARSASRTPGGLLRGQGLSGEQGHQGDCLRR